MINKFYMFLFLLILAACNSGGGGGGSSSNPGGGNPNPGTPGITHTEETKNYSLQASQNISLNLTNEGFTSVTIEQAASQGSFSGTYPNFSYTASATASGSDSARILLSKSGVTKRITFSFFINTIPVANNFSVSLRYGQSLSFDLKGTDIDGDVLTYQIVQVPSSGTLYHTSSGKEVAYDSANSAYTTNFFYTVSDGKSTSGIGKVDIFVVSEMPAFTSASNYTLNEDASQIINLSVSSPSTHSYSIIQNPAHGVISGTGSNLTYTPSSNYFGPDSVKVRVTNSQGGFVEQLISLTINPINDAPVMSNQLITTIENTDTFAILNGSDIDGNLITYSKVSNTSLGMSIITGDRLFYYPNTNTFGTDSLVIQLCDNGQPILCSQATINFIITRQPKAPIALDQIVPTSGGVETQITLAGTYYNINNVSVNITTQPTKGVLVYNGGLSYTYTANLESDGEILVQDAFAFTLSEDGFTSAQAQVSISIDYTPKFIGINLNGNIFKEYPGLKNILHQDLTQDQVYTIFENNQEIDTGEETYILNSFHMAMSNAALSCPTTGSVFVMISTSGLSKASGEKLTFNEENYECDAGVLVALDGADKLVTNSNLIFRQVNELEFPDTQFGVLASSQNNNTNLNFLSLFALNSFENLEIDLVNNQKEISTISSFSDLLIEDSINGDPLLIEHYFLKSDENLIHFQTSENLEIYHLVQEQNGELLLVEKYYKTATGMSRLQDLITAWEAVNPDMEEVEPLTVPAGRILIVDNSIFVKTIEQVFSYYEELDNSLIYEYSQQSKLNILNRKVP